LWAVLLPVFSSLLLEIDRGVGTTLFTQGSGSFLSWTPYSCRVSFFLPRLLSAFFSRISWNPPAFLFSLLVIGFFGAQTFVGGFGSATLHPKEPTRASFFYFSVFR